LLFSDECCLLSQINTSFLKLRHDLGLTRLKIFQLELQDCCWNFPSRKKHLLELVGQLLVGQLLVGQLCEMTRSSDGKTLVQVTVLQQ